MENGITRRVEEVLIGIQGVKRVISVARENLGVVTLVVEDFADINDVLDDVETAVDGLVEFPPQDAEAPIVVKVSPQPFVISLVLYGSVPEMTLKRWAERLADQMLQVPGISLVALQGDRNYRFLIPMAISLAFGLMFASIILMYKLTINGKVYNFDSVHVKFGRYHHAEGRIRTWKIQCGSKNRRHSR